MLYFARLNFDQQSRLTEVQKQRIVWHDRNDKGGIDIPGGRSLPAPISEEKPTLEGELRNLAAAAAAFGLTETQLGEMAERLRAKFGGGDGQG
jgi:hypothetical protein